MPLPDNHPARRLQRLRRELAERVDANLSGVHLAVLPNLPVDGLAFGDLVAVSARLFDQAPENLLHAVAHELAHVFQQRSGRVRPLRRVGGCAVTVDDALEAEAQVVARSVVCGERVSLRAPAADRPHPPVLQPLISVGGQGRSSEKDFSAAFTRILALVPQGPAWLSWALRTPGPAFHFADEPTLLSAIQLGLHGTAVVPFASAGLRLAPALLLDLGDPDFGNIVGSLEAGQLTPAAQAALASHGLRTEADFAQLASALAGLGASATLSLASASLADQVALHEQFVADPAPPPPAAAATAARFAAATAQNPAEFAAAYAFYLIVSGGAKNAPPANVWTQLAPLVFPYLKSPVLDPGLSDADLASQVGSWLGQSASIGFPTLGTAIANCAAYAGLDLTQPLDPNETADRIRAYLFRLAQVVQPPQPPAPAPVVTRLQDGVTRWIDFTTPVSRARFQLDASGLLTLREFSPPPASAQP